MNRNTYPLKPISWARLGTLLDLVDTYMGKGMYEIAEIYKRAADVMYTRLIGEQDVAE